jgi:sortase A
MAKGSRSSRGVKRAITSLLFAGLLAASVVALAASVMTAGKEQGEDQLKSVVTPTIGEIPQPAQVKEEEPKPEEEKEPAEEPQEEAAAAEEAAVAEEAPEEEAAAGGADPSIAPEPASTALSLTVPAMGKSGQPVAEGVDEATLMNGPGHAPTTGYPWQEGANVYIAGHVLGYEGTGSYMDFAALPNMTYGDEIILTDANGTTYTYVVSEILEVSIYDLWVMDPTGKNQVSLQTCINPPAYDVRLVVRGDLQSVTPA